MQFTNVPSEVTLSNFKRTKIIATLGPSSNSYDDVLSLIKAGVNGLRLNFSHGTHKDHGESIKWVRKAAKEIGKPVALIADLQGPKIRLGDFDGIVNVAKGHGLSFAYDSDYATSGHIPTQYDLALKVKRGEKMYVCDGRVKLNITSVRGGIVFATAENDGILIKRKGINLPDTDFDGDIITPRDKSDLAYCSTQDVDYVALSFVQSAADVEQLRNLLKGLNSSAKIIAKIETKSAVDNLEEIVKASDAVMVARGDLAFETEPESVPIVQRQIMGLGLKYSKPTIVATQMLANMSDTPESTRAEVSDVASAVLVGADCLMLSDETAIGKYPLEAVKMMKRVILYTEEHAPLKVNFADNQPQSRQLAISLAILSLAENVGAVAIIAETKSGATAKQIASHRSLVPIIAVTNDSRTAGQLAIVYGTKSFLRPPTRWAAKRLTDWLRESKVLNKGDIVVTASGRHPGVVGTTDTIKVRVLN
jgi:pyruvate kinase